MATPDSTKAPAFQFYPNDFLSDSNVIVMSLQERGAYITLICICWQQGSLPADQERLARLCGVPATAFRRLWPALEPCFRPDATAGRLIHPRLEREREKQDTFKRRQSDRGKLGGRPRKPEESGKESGKKATALSPLSGPALSDKSSSSSSSSSDFSQREPAPVKVAHKGNRLMVWHWQHEDLGRRLGAKASSFDLLGWYSRLEAELERTGESWADQWKWLQERLYRDAKLSLPNLMGKRVEPERRRVPTPEETKAMLARSRADG